MLCFALFNKQTHANDIIYVGNFNLRHLYNYLFRRLMRSLLFVCLFMAAALVSDAQSPSALIADYQHIIRSNEGRIRNQMMVSDDLFFDMVDTLTGYCTDSRFTLAQQLVNIQGLARFMTKVNDAEQVRSGQCTNLLLFYFSIMDWRRDGNYYDNLNSFSSFAMKCASFFAEDTTGIKFISKVAEDNPIQVLTNAGQLTECRKYRPLIENVILRDPEYAKRYFFSDNLISSCASTSYRKDVKGLYDLFEQYGPRTKAFILYDAVRRKEIRPEEADSISHDHRAMIGEMVKIMKRPNAVGIKSIHREMELRCTDWFSQSSRWNPAVVTAQFNRFDIDEKLAVLVFGYRECKPQLLDRYLSLLLQPGLASVSPALIGNLEGANLPDFLHLLDKRNKLLLFLSWFSEANKERLAQVVLSDDNDDGAQTLESLSKNKVWATEIQEASSSGRTNRKDAPPEIATPVISLTKKSQPLFDDVSGQVHIPLSDSSRAILGLKKNVFMALQDISSFIHKPYAKDLLLYAAIVEPDEVFKKVDMFKGKYWCKEILEAATLNAPLTAKQYLNNITHPVPVILGYSTDSTIIKFMELGREAKLESKPFLLFDEMASNCMSLTDATTVCDNNEILFKELMGIASRKSYIGRYNVEREMNYYALKYIRGINDKVNLPEEERFATVDNLTCNELYYMMVYGREEVFDATFDGLFSRFLSKCSASGYWSARRFANLPHYRSFIAMCAAYNKLDKFLSIFSPPDRDILLTAFASSLDKERDELSDAATVAQTIANTSNTLVLLTLQNTIKNSYTKLEMAHDYNGMAIYGILSALFRDKALTDRKWFALMARKYRVGSLATLTNASLMEHKPFVERMYFYNDEDGLDSYRNFLATFSASSDWHIDQYPTYVKVTPTSGKKIEIYANKPELEESGDREISKIILDNKYTVAAIVHRGHSFHTDVTVARIPASARFIFFGSCGGFYKINGVLRKAPDASIISTRQIGVKEINDPVIFSFNEYVRQGRDINWKLFWDEMSYKLGSNTFFNDYVPPHRNLESLFVKAYYQIMGNE